MNVFNSICLSGNSSRLSTQTIDLSSLDRGMYFIKISSPELAVTRKFPKIW